MICYSSNTSYCLEKMQMIALLERNSGKRSDS